MSELPSELRSPNALPAGKGPRGGEGARGGGAGACRGGAARRRLAALVGVACWGYPVVVVAAWGVMYFAADAWWPATLLAFAPRWAWALPLAVLVPLAAWATFPRRRHLRPLAAGGIVCLVGLMGFRLSPTSGEAGEGGSHRLRVMTLNAHRVRLDGAALQELLARERPQVVLFQDWSDRVSTVFHRREPGAGGPGGGGGDWHVRRDGEFFVASRYPILAVEDLALPAAVAPSPGTAGDQHPGGAVCYTLETPLGPVRVINVHLASPHAALDVLAEKGVAGGAAALEANSDRRRRESAAVAACVARDGTPVLVGGDFNTPVESTVFRSAWEGLSDGFSEAGTGLGYTFVTKRVQVRIDHLLGGPGWRCRRCVVGPPLGSPHRPVIAVWERVRGGTGSEGRAGPGGAGR